MPGKKTPDFEAGIKIEEINYSFLEHLEKKISELPENYAIMLLVDANEYNDIILGLVKKFVSTDKTKGVFLTANKQSSQLEQLFFKESKNFDQKKIYFLDCASKELAKEMDNAMVCNPQNLIDLNISINQAFDVIPAGGFFIMDSISTLAIYNDERVLKKFVKSVVEKCYAKKINGIFLCNNTKNMKELIDDISPFFDEAIDAEKL